MPERENVTIRCLDCQRDLVTLWNADVKAESSVKDLIFWRHTALASHRAVDPQCTASSASVAHGWPPAAAK